MKTLKKWAKGELILATIIAIIALAVGCMDDKASESQAGSEPEASVADAQEAHESYSVTGRVRSITPDRDFIMVRHDAIDGFMDAMTMPFAVPDTGIVTGLVAGDSVEFQISVSAGEAAITSLEIR